MKNLDGFEELTKIVSPQRRIDRFQKLVPQIIRDYLIRKSQLETIGRKEKKFVKEIYYILDQILKEGLKKPCAFGGKHLLDIKDDPALRVDIVIEYCVAHKLKTKLLESAKGTGITKGFVERRYVNKEKLNTDREQLSLFGKTPNFYIFLDNLSNNKGN